MPKRKLYNLKNLGSFGRRRTGPVSNKENVSSSISLCQLSFDTMSYQDPPDVSPPVSPPKKKRKGSWRPSFPQWRTPSWMRRSTPSLSPDVVMKPSISAESGPAWEESPPDR